MKGFFQFRAVCWVDEGKNGREEVSDGVTYAETYAEAMRNIEQYFGDELSVITMTAIDPCSVYVLKGYGADPFLIKGEC